MAATKSIMGGHWQEAYHYLSSLTVWNLIGGAKENVLVLLKAKLQVLHKLLLLLLVLLLLLIAAAVVSAVAAVCGGPQYCRNAVYEKTSGQTVSIGKQSDLGVMLTTSVV